MKKLIVLAAFGLFAVANVNAQSDAKVVAPATITVASDADVAPAATPVVAAEKEEASAKSCCKGKSTACCKDKVAKKESCGSKSSSKACCSKNKSEAKAEATPPATGSAKE